MCCLKLLLFIITIYYILLLLFLLLLSIYDLLNTSLFDNNFTVISHNVDCACSEVFKNHINLQHV